MKYQLKLFQKKKERTVGPGTKAKAKLELIKERFFSPGEESLKDMILFGKNDEDEIPNPASVLAEDAITRTLGFGAIGDRYQITSRNMIAWERLKMRLNLALQKDPGMEKQHTQRVYNLTKRLYENLKGRSVYGKQIDVEVVEQEPYVVQVPVGGYRPRPDDQRLE